MLLDTSWDECDLTSVHQVFNETLLEYIAYKMETQSNEVCGTSNLLIKYNT